MKKSIILLIALFAATSSYSQRIAFIESEYILSKMPEYSEANKKLESQSERWKKEIDEQMGVLDMMYKKFQAEQSLYTDKMREDNINAISEKESLIAKLQQDKFGPNGELFQKRQQLMEPIMDKMMSAINSIAERKNYDLVLDKSSSSVIMYSNDKLNISEEVLKAMNY